MIKTKDKTIKVAFQLGLFFLAAQVIIWLFFWKRLPPQVPLFYSRPWGERQLVGPIALALLPTFSFLIFLTNLILASLIPQEEKLASQLLTIFAAIFNFLCLITLLKIIILII